MNAPTLVAGGDAYAQLHGRCRTLVDQELNRLARRTPTLGNDHLAIVEATLHTIVDSLLLSRVRASMCSDHLTVLFDLEGTS